MEPTHKVNESIVVSSIPYMFFPPKLGDIVVFKDKKTGKYFLKRITNIKDEKYFLEGDNKNDSLDSTKIGWIERKQIIGKSLCRF